MDQMQSPDLVSAFVTALRRVISDEPDPARRLTMMGDMRRQMTTVLHIAPYGNDPEDEAKLRAELACSMETAYFTILSSEALGHVGGQSGATHLAYH